MLPPVRAALNSFADYQAQSQQTLPRQRIDVAGNAANTDIVVSAALSGGRLDILSLSAQLQLAQGVSIFAETIGKLIKLPRRDGEALLDYAKRLSEAVRAMSPPERAALERMLNQLVRGVSLRLLAEILSNPGGPEAAKIALRMETAQLLDRDLAAKAVVSSYRQNAGAEPAGSPPRPFPATPIPSVQVAERPASPAAETDVSSPSGAADHADVPAGQSEDIDRADEKQLPTRKATPPLAEAEARGTAASTQRPTARSMDHNAAGTPSLEGGGSPSGRTAGDDAGAITQKAATEPSESEASDPPQALSDEKPETPPSQDAEGQARSIRNASAERRPSLPVFYDGPALARLSQRNHEQARPAIAADGTISAAMTEWLAEIADEGNVEVLEPLPAKAGVLPGRLGLEELRDDESPAMPVPPNKEAAAPSAKTSPATMEEPEDLSPAPRLAGNPANGGGQSATTAEPGEQVVPPLPLPAVLREGVPLPYVPYPPEEQERDPEERRTREISKTDEDGEQQHSSGEQAFQDDRPTGDQDEEPEDDARGSDADDDASRANDLYWRMAGWA